MPSGDLKVPIGEVKKRKVESGNKDLEDVGSLINAIESLMILLCIRLTGTSRFEMTRGKILS
jgi:hypothetical protein